MCSLSSALWLWGCGLEQRWVWASRLIVVGDVSFACLAQFDVNCVCGITKNHYVQRSGWTWGGTPYQTQQQIIDEYWQKEVAVRFVTEKLTAREWEDLHELMPLPQRKLALSFFGQAANVDIWREWALELMQEHQPPLKPGDVVNPKLELWSVLKGYMRAKQQLDGDRNFGACSCLCKTYFMPEGCGCRPPNKVRPALDVTQCSKCSTCMRCGKSLGSKVTGKHPCLSCHIQYESMFYTSALLSFNHFYQPIAKVLQAVGATITYFLPVCWLCYAWVFLALNGPPVTQ